MAGDVVTQACPNCGAPVTMKPYDIGSGPELSCPHCDWCWGADGQPLHPLEVPDPVAGGLRVTLLDQSATMEPVEDQMTEDDETPIGHMSRAEHYRLAEETALNQVHRTTDAARSDVIALAQVHATLAAAGSGVDFEAGALADLDGDRPL